MKNLKKLVASTVIMTMLMALFIMPAQIGAFVSDSQRCITLNLLKGEGSGVTEEYLSKESTRIQSAIIFLRLKDKELAALTYTGGTNFTDAAQVNWQAGKNILAYLKANPQLGWVGFPDGSFRPNERIDAKAMHKVLLEALGYKQGVDFTWEQAISFAGSHGFKTALSASPFINSNIASALVEALKLKPKNSSLTLAQTLADNSMLSTTAAMQTGLVNSQEPLEIKILTDESGNPKYPLSYMTDLQKAIEAYTNTKMVWDGSASYPTTLKIRLAAGGALPDIINLNPLTSSEIINLANKGIIVPLDNLIMTYAPNIKSLYFGANKSPFDLNKLPDGKLYFIGYFYGGSPEGGTVSVRLDWLNRLNLKIPETTEEFYQYLKLCQEKDMNGNGIKDETWTPTYYLSQVLDGTSIPQAFGVILSSTAMNSFALGPDGKVVNQWMLPGAKDCAAYFAKLYTEGLIDPAIFIAGTKQDHWISMLAQNKSSGLYGKVSSYVYGPKLPAGGKFKNTYPLKGPDGKSGTSKYNPNCYGKYAISKYCKNQVGVTRFLNYLYSDRHFIEYSLSGVEGVDWVIGSDGKAVNTQAYKDGLAKDSANWEYMKGWNFNGHIPFKGYEMPSKTDYLHTWDNSKPELYGWEFDYEMGRLNAIEKVAVFGLKLPIPTDEENNELSAVPQDLWLYMDEMKGKFMMGVEPISNWDKFIAKCKELGIDKATAVYQKMSDRAK